MDIKKDTFPKDFLWGAATSAHQVEGNNTNNDWWEWERSAGLKEVSGAACRHYELYGEDFDLARGLGHNCHRLSIEWSRIEPEEGRFSDEEIGHYIKVIDALKERGMEPVVTLHHFTNPVWFKNLGGWENADSPRYFERYTGKIVSALCGKVRFWATINEPTVYAYYSYLNGKWPPQKKSILKAIKVLDNLALAHVRAYKLIHAIYKDKGAASPMVSIAHHVRSFVPKDNSFKNRLGACVRDALFNQWFIKKLRRRDALDFIGINYYTREVVDVKHWSPASILLDVEKDGRAGIGKNSMGWDIYPEGILDNLLALKRYGLPIFILENGICTSDDRMRWDFIEAHLKNISAAIGGGARVIGYIYWSLLDNYEWADGYAPRFGLIEVDRATYKRTVKDSARKFAQACSAH